MLAGAGHGSGPHRRVRRQHRRVYAGRVGDVARIDARTSIGPGFYHLQYRRHGCPRWPGWQGLVGRRMPSVLPASLVGIGVLLLGTAAVAAAFSRRRPDSEATPAFVACVNGSIRFPDLGMISMDMDVRRCEAVSVLAQLGLGRGTALQMLCLCALLTCQLRPRCSHRAISFERIQLSLPPIRVVVDSKPSAKPQKMPPLRPLRRSRPVQPKNRRRLRQRQKKTMEKRGRRKKRKRRSG